MRDNKRGHVTLYMRFNYEMLQIIPDRHFRRRDGRPKFYKCLKHVSINIGPEFSQPNSTETVSYTHLDVYKRQD